MKHLIIIASILSIGLLSSCKDSEGTVGDAPKTENGQDRDYDTITGDDYVYHLPVIFHVFYNDKNNPSQYITQNRLKELVGNVNELYEGLVYTQNTDTTASQNIHIQFELAAQDENGKTLSTPGVEYIHLEADSIDCEQFMKDKSYVQYVWNPNDYINVMVYTFKQPDSNSTILGISNMPYQVKGYPEIEGLEDGKSYPLNKPSKFPYCVSLNAIYVDQKYEGTRYTTDKYKNNYTYTTADPNATLAHELGHYLGLLHAFTELDKDNTHQEPVDSCKDTDYCTDTPSYNRPKYLSWLKEFREKAQKENPDTALTLTQMAVRTNNKEEEWLADNFMDYSVCFNTRFTPEQANRMRQVLYYSPLIPGPKKARPTTRTWAETPAEEPDLPIVLAKERTIRTKDIKTITRTRR